MSKPESASAAPVHPRCSAADPTIDVWEIHPHYDADYDYLITDEGTKVEEYVALVAERWLDGCPDVGEGLKIRVKVRQMKRHEYEELTTGQP